MRKIAIVLALGALVGGAAVAGNGAERIFLVAGGTEEMLEAWTPGTGDIVPGGRIRGWSTRYEVILYGPAGELASGAGPVTMNCNLDRGLTGSCWGTFEYTNALGKWVGAWQGTFNFATGAGAYRASGHGQGGLQGLTLKTKSVYPGFAVSPTGAGYVYSTVKGLPDF